MSETSTNERASSLNTLPLIPLDGAVVFPYTTAVLPLGKEVVPALEASLREGRLVLLAARRQDSDSSLPLALQLHRVGVVARIEQAGQLGNGVTGMAVRGLVRADLGEQIQTAPYPRFAYTERPDSFDHSPELQTLMDEVHAAIDAVLDLRPEVPQELRNFVRSINDPGQLADNTGYSPDYTFQERQELLETFDVTARLRKVRDFYRKQYTLLEVQRKLRQEVQDGAEKQQREFFLRQQLRAIQKELGEDDPEAAGLDDLREKLAVADLPENRSEE